MTTIQWMRAELRSGISAYMDASGRPDYTAIVEACGAALGVDIDDPDCPVWDEAIHAFAPYLRSGRPALSGPAEPSRLALSGPTPGRDGEQDLEEEGGDGPYPRGICRDRLRVNAVYCVWRRGAHGMPLRPCVLIAGGSTRPDGTIRVCSFEQVLAHGDKREVDRDFHLSETSFEAYATMEEATSAWAHAFRLWAKDLKEWLDERVAEFGADFNPRRVQIVRAGSGGVKAFPASTPSSGLLGGQEPPRQLGYRG